MFRELNEQEIEVRVQSCSAKGAILTLYKTARTDANILDETLGPGRWQCRFYEAGGILFCSLGIKCGDEWVWKDDSGSAGSIEEEKSKASDCFKRSGFRWGIGRSLYTAPHIWVPSDRCSIKPGKNGKPTCYDRFHVEKIRIENGAITGLSIWNDTAKCRAFTWVKQGEQQKLTEAGR